MAEVAIETEEPADEVTLEPPVGSWERFKLALVDAGGDNWQDQSGWTRVETIAYKEGPLTAARTILTFPGFRMPQTASPRSQSGGSTDESSEFAQVREAAPQGVPRGAPPGQGLRDQQGQPALQGAPGLTPRAVARPAAARYHSGSMRMWLMA